MAKKVYIGVSGKARRVKRMYIGVNTSVPTYGTTTVTETLSATTITSVFNVTNGDDYYFVGDGNTFTTNNAGKSISTASTTLVAKRNLRALSFSYSYSSESEYDKFTLIVGGVTVEDGVSGATTNKTWSGSLPAGQAVVFSYKKDSSKNGNDDECTFSNVTVSYDESVITGYETKNVARRIKKAYIGVAGKARLFWSPGEPSYYGTVDSLRAAAQELRALSNATYAVFTGGKPNNTTGGSASSQLVAYDKSLTKLEGTNGLYAYASGATTLGSYCMFAGGRSGAGSTSGLTREGKAIDTSLTVKSFELSNAREHLGAASVGGYAIFCGGGYTGYGSTDSDYYDTVNIYNTSLTRTNTTVGVEGWYAGGSTASFAVFVNSGEVAYTFDSSLTMIQHTTTVHTLSSTQSAHFNGHVIFAPPTKSSYGISGYDDALTMKANIITPSLWRYNSAYAETSDALIMAGGYAGSLANDKGRYSAVVDSFDLSFTCKVSTPLSLGRDELAGTALGGYAFFGGGYYYKSSSDKDVTNVVDVYVA